MRVKIDLDLCTGHGRCYTTIPELFDPIDDGRATVKPEADPVPAELVARAEHAVLVCPESAISVVED